MSMKEEINKMEKKTEIQEYEVAPISKLEFMLYLSYWVGLLVLGCYSVHTLAYRPITLQYFIKQDFMKKTYFGLYESTVEYFWTEMKTIISDSWKTFTIYIIISKILRAKASPNCFMFGCIAMSLFFNYYHSSLKFLAFEGAILLISSIAGLLRLKSLVWISGLALLYKLKDYGKLDFFSYEYIFSSSYSYCALLITRAISVGLTIAEAPKYNMKLLLEMNLYYWYFPAIIGWRMMVVKDFIAQIYQPYVIKNWKIWFFLAFRIVFWFSIWNIVVALVPIRLVFRSHDIKAFDIFIVTGGQLFYGIHVSMIFVFIYNASYLITQLDGFLTAEGPECICHIALYNRLWKTFDVGMHLWIKENIFRPIAKLGDFKKTRIIAVFASFWFVVIFHRLNTSTVLWISLNIAQFFLYNFLVYGFNNSSWGFMMQRTFSPGWNRRIIAFAGAISWLSSIYGFGSFSYGFQENNDMYMTLFKKDGNRYYHRALAFGFICYCHSQMALTVNQYLLKRKEKIH